MAAVNTTEAADATAAVDAMAVAVNITAAEDVTAAAVKAVKEVEAVAVVIAVIAEVKAVKVVTVVIMDREISRRANPEAARMKLRRHKKVVNGNAKVEEARAVEGVVEGAEKAERNLNAARPENKNNALKPK